MKKKYLLKYFPKNFDKLEYEEVTEFYKISRRHEREHYFNENGYYYVVIADIVTKMIPKENYEKNMKKPDGRIIKKYRYKLPLERTDSAFLDVYKGDLEGLNIINIVAYKKHNFRKLGWFGEEITDNPKYSFYSLTHNPASTYSKDSEMQL